MNYRLLAFSFLLLLPVVFPHICNAQNADFNIPDTVCEDTPVAITNVQPPAASSYRWSFCAGNASYEPDGINLGNPNQILNAPRYITFVRDSLSYFTFVTSTGNSRVIRCFYGNSLDQTPVSTTDFGSFGAVTTQVAGIQVKNDNGNWYGFVLNGNKLIRLVFGPSLLSNPAFQVINLSKVVSGSGLALVKSGADWIGFCTDMGADNLVRFDFGTTLATDPSEVLLGNTGQLNKPASIVLADENNLWYAFICNIGNSTLTRVKFGTSLQNMTPAGANLLNVGGLDLNAGITLINDCGGYNGFVTNCIIQSDLCILHLVFPTGLGGTVTGYHIQNNGVLNKPYGLSEIMRKGDTLYAFAANFGSSSITRMFFPSCSDASQPFYVGIDPPPISYPDSGNYNILLTVDEGLPTRSSKCRNIKVLPKPVLSLGADKVICEGTAVVLDAGPGSSHYAWSTGATTQKINVDTAGTYSVTAQNSADCTNSDTINITVNKVAATQVDTTICKGLSYWAQHAMQTSSGIYRDTLQLATGCDSIVTTTLQVDECPLLIWFPNAFTPDGDGRNDFYKPVGKDITNYRIQIFDRWGALTFQSTDINKGWDGTVKGEFAMPDIYTYIAVFETTSYPGVTHHEKGTFMLLR